jgi:hypothetical protein
MNINITKEQLEKQIGHLVQDFNLVPLYEDKTCVGLTINVKPVQPIKEILIKFLIIDDYYNNIFGEL